MGKQILVIISGILFLFMMILGLNLVTAAPSGGTITSKANSTAPADPPGTFPAFAGNVSDININGYSTTGSWQGYYGNVSGVVELTDGNNKTMYNWSVASPTGEVYASNDTAVIWTHIQCLNFTANGTICSTDDFPRNGSMSLCGLNVTQLDSSYNIATGDADGVNQTFNRRDHAGFYTNSIQFTSGVCSNTKVYNSSGVGSFDEVLLWSPDSKSVVFASLLKNNGDGFDGSTHDFEMLVLEDGHNGDINVKNYYFYLEIQ